MVYNVVGKSNKTTTLLYSRRLVEFDVIMNFPEHILGQILWYKYYFEWRDKQLDVSLTDGRFTIQPINIFKIMRHLIPDEIIKTKNIDFHDFIVDEDFGDIDNEYGALFAFKYQRNHEISFWNDVQWYDIDGMYAFGIEEGIEIDENIDIVEDGVIYAQFMVYPSDPIFGLIKNN